MLLGSGGAAPADLLSGLSKRGVSVTVVTGPAAAMVELAREPAGALIVVEPQRQTWLHEFIEALKHYHPRTVRWGYCKSGPSCIAQLQPLEPRSNNHHSSKDQRSNANGKDKPRYIVPDPKSPLGRAQSQIPRERVRSLVVKVQNSSEVDEPLISEEELAMLLGPGPDEAGEPA